MGEPVEQSATEAARAEHLCPFGKRRRLEVLQGETSRRQLRDVRHRSSVLGKALARPRSAEGTISHGSLARAFQGICVPMA
jgi:hypothetical protein